MSVVPLAGNPTRDGSPSSRPLPELLDLRPDDLVRALGGQGRARAVYALLREGRDPFLELSVGARSRLASVSRPSALERRALTRARDGTTKVLLGLEDGRAVEAVLIPEPRRTTLCISSQVGCARGCIFCLTARMKLERDLRPGEIAAQVHEGLRIAREEGLPRLRNVVFMGMGEPLDNLNGVRVALEIITGSGLGLALGPGHVTISTVGPSPRAVRAARHLPGRFAWSLHSADDETRRKLVPTQRHPVEALRDAFQEVLEARRQPLFVEVTLIDGVNDGDRDADRIVSFFRDFGVELRFNLLPLNPIGPFADLRASSAERVRGFAERLVRAGLFVRSRRPRGREEGAACGQLAILSPADLRARPGPKHERSVDSRASGTSRSA